MPTAIREVRHRDKKTRATRDVRRQRVHDMRRPMSWNVYEARIQAITEARQMVRQGEAGSRYALRQALVDLAACCEELALPMLAPDEKLLA